MTENASTSPFKPLGYHGPHVVVEPGWGVWLRGARVAYLACRTQLHMTRREAIRWVLRARP